LEKNNIETKKEEIQKLGLNAIHDYFKVDFNKFKPEFIKLIHDKAKLGMQFEREMNLSKRAVEMNYIRVFKLIASDKKELKRYIKTSMPKYSPI
jgi:hypothetical protein